MAWGTGVPFLELDRFGGRNAIVILRKPLRLVWVEVDPFDAVRVAAALRDRVHRRHRQFPGSPAAGLQYASTQWPRPPNRWGYRGRQPADVRVSRFAIDHPL